MATKPIDFSQLSQADLAKLEAALLQAKNAAGFRTSNQPRFEQDLNNRRIVPKRSPFEFLARGLSHGMADTAESSAMAQAAEIRRQGAENAQADLSTVDNSLRQAGTDPVGVQAALMKAKQSAYPGVQQYGMQRQEVEDARRKSVLDAMLKKSSTASVQDYSLTGDTKQLQESPKIMDSNGAIISVNPDGSGLRSLTPNRFTPGTVQTPMGTSPTSVDTLSGKAIPTAPGGTRVDVNTKLGENLGKAVIEADMGQISANLPKVQSLADSESQITAATQLVKQGITAGFGADTRMSLGKLAVMLGADPDPNDLRGEQVAKLLGRQVLGQAKSLGVNPSDGDVKLLQDLLNTGNNSPQTIARILEVSQRLAMRGMARHNGFVEQVEGTYKDQLPGGNLSRYRVQSAVDQAIVEQTLKDLDQLKQAGDARPAAPVRRQQLTPVRPPTP